MIPLQKKPGTTPASLGGGPEDVGAFLYWLMNRPRKKRRVKRLVLSSKQKRFIKLLQALDAARMLQLARTVS